MVDRVSGIQLGINLVDLNMVEDVVVALALYEDLLAGLGGFFSSSLVGFDFNVNLGSTHTLFKQ